MVEASSSQVNARETRLIDLAERIGWPGANLSLLELSMSHRSWCSEVPGSESNERLEFLGDSVLGLVITDYLFHLFPTMPEGELAKVRASVVSAPALAKAAAQVSLGEALLLGKGEESSGGRLKESILADALEALIGALYLEGGWSAAQSFVLGLLAQKARQAAKVPGGADYKTRLQEFVTRRDDEVPRYEVQGFGPDHARMFTACVYVGGELVGRGDGRSKKQAEQAAAQQAWGRLGAGEPESSKPSKGECDAGVA